MALRDPRGGAGRRLRRDPAAVRDAVTANRDVILRWSGGLVLGASCAPSAASEMGSPALWYGFFAGIGAVAALQVYVVAAAVFLTVLRRGLLKQVALAHAAPLAVVGPGLIAFACSDYGESWPLVVAVAMGVLVVMIGYSIVLARFGRRPEPSDRNPAPTPGRSLE